MWNLSLNDNIQINDHSKWDDEPFINKNLIERIEEIKQITETEEDRIRVHNFFEDANKSKIASVFQNATLDDILPVCYIAVRRFPAEYVTVLLDYVLEKEDK